METLIIGLEAADAEGKLRRVEKKMSLDDFRARSWTRQLMLFLKTVSGLHGTLVDMIDAARRAKTIL